MGLKCRCHSRFLVNNRCISRFTMRHYNSQCSSSIRCTPKLLAWIRICKTSSSKHSDLGRPRQSSSSANSRMPFTSIGLFLQIWALNLTNQWERKTVKIWRKKMLRTLSPNRHLPPNLKKTLNRSTNINSWSNILPCISWGRSELCRWRLQQLMKRRSLCRIPWRWRALRRTRSRQMMYGSCWSI